MNLEKEIHTLRREIAKIKQQLNKSDKHVTGLLRKVGKQVADIADLKKGQKP